MRAAFLLLLSSTCSFAFEHFEARHLHPVDLTPDGSRLLAVNPLESRLSVFAIGEVAEPLLIAEIPVGLEPVTVRALTNHEAWVVNEVSDSVSIIDLSRGVVTRTLSVPDEPADVVFAAGKAFISCGRANRLAVIDTVTFSEIASIPLAGIFPRALALNSDGSRIFAAFLLSGNNTTTLHFRQAPPQPAPTNSALPEPPQVGLIVPDSDPRIGYDVLDHDVAEIDTATFQIVRYHEGLGTNILGLAVGPNNTLWTASSEARNLIRFEPELNGIFSRSRIALSNSGPSPALIDLNPHAATASIPSADRDLSLAQPMTLLPDAERSSVWLAAFGSDRVAELDAAGNILRRIDLRITLQDTVRGPRGLAKSAVLNRLFVLNKLSDTITTIDLATHAVVSEVAVSSHDPMPADQRRGRGFFFDSRLSGNGTVSCGACHFDADNDGIAWDLGDPGGEMLTLTGYNFSLAETEPVERPVHPMKGPMVTQSLRGIKDAGPFHWRGDKQSIQEFNSSFAKLQGGAELAPADMDEVAAYIGSLRNHPNPNRNLDNSLKTQLAGGNPVVGRQRFNYINTCSKCHPGERGTNHVIDEFTSVLTRQPVKNATLEHFYRRLGFTPDQATSPSGFGFTHDGSGSDLARGHEYDQDIFHVFPNGEADVTAYLLSAETGTVPAVGKSLTLRRGESDPEGIRSVLENQAQASKCDLIVRGTVGGEPRAFAYDPATGLYQPDSTDAAPVSFATLLNQLYEGDAVTLLGVPIGAGTALALDRDLNGFRNHDEPFPVTRLAASQRFEWTSLSPDWFPQSSPDLKRWQPLHAPIQRSPEPLSSIHVAPAGSRAFYRLARTW